MQLHQTWNAPLKIESLVKGTQNIGICLLILSIGQLRPLIVYFSPLQQQFIRKNCCRLQWDLNSDRLSRRRELTKPWIQINHNKVDEA